jgi:predicted GIY-YIG superfamily endonuclease
MESHTVYLLHFSQRYQHAGHYTGSTNNLTKRLNQHAKGQGARLLAVVQAVGITWTLARTWEGGKQHERKIKRQGGASRRCPICKGLGPVTGRVARLRAGHGHPGRL